MGRKKHIIPSQDVNIYVDLLVKIQNEMLDLKSQRKYQAEKVRKQRQDLYNLTLAVNKLNDEREKVIEKISTMKSDGK